MQDVIELFQLEDDDQSIIEEQPNGSQLFLTLSLAAVSGVSSTKSMSMRGFIQGKPMRILVESGAPTTSPARIFLTSYHGCHYCKFLYLAGSK
jgi:hypothetical protein